MHHRKEYIKWKTLCTKMSRICRNNSLGTEGTSIELKITTVTNWGRVKLTALIDLLLYDSIADRRYFLRVTSFDGIELKKEKGIIYIKKSDIPEIYYNFEEFIKRIIFEWTLSVTLEDKMNSYRDILDIFNK